MGAARRARSRLGVVEAVLGEHALEGARRVEKLNLNQLLSSPLTPAMGAARRARPQMGVVEAVLCTGVLFCCTLLERSLVYVLGEELLLLQWLRCCCLLWLVMVFS